MASIARHHAEWLSLVEVSGPFLSMPVLLRAFPQGLDAHDPEVFRDLRLAYDEWQADLAATKPSAALHRAWVLHVLREVLGWDGTALRGGQDVPQALATVLREHGVTLRPDLAVLTPGDLPNPHTPRLLVQTYAAGVGLDRAYTAPGSGWMASPATRMMELLHGTGVRLGLVTNGEHWMLVDAPKGQTTGFVSWYAQYWLEEKVTLQAFRALLTPSRFFGVAPKDTLEGLLAESASDQQEVTDQLGYQVRRAVEVLVQAIDRIDRERKGALLRDVPETQLYNAALTVMMRLVFLLSAEEQGRLFPNSGLYREAYGVATLRDQLREVADRHGEEVLERRYDAWARLIATFRAVHGGVTHEAMRSPAYGGGLLDPDRHPLLEGRAPGTRWRDAPADPLPIHNRTVLHLLDALQVLQVKVPGGGPAEARRLSFRALGVEQIGHVYEGLLDHTAVRAKEPVLGLKGPKDSEEEVTLSRLESLAAKSPEALVAWLKDATGRSEKALAKDVAYAIPKTDRRWMVVCERDDALYKRVSPYAGLVRDDTVGLPVVIHAGSVYVTQGSERRSTGTHYTPPSLTEPIVRYTLEPLVYIGPAEGLSQEQWTLRSPTELLALRVCDIAMGSGAFLVQACRYLAERLVEAWGRYPDDAVRTLPAGEVSHGVASERLLPAGIDERLALARRLVADRCLYGVDKNPMAVEMARLSLWLITFERERPFTFVDHALRCGDSLLGLTDPEQVKWFHMDPARGRTVHHPDDVVGTRGLFNFVEQLGPAFEKAASLRRQLESMPDDDIRDSEAKAALLSQAERAMALVRVVADLVIASALETAGKGPKKLDERLTLLEMPLASALDLRVPWSQREKLVEELATQARRMLNAGKPAGTDDRRPFHWALEFPEVFAEGEGAKRGFDAVVGNPPFMGGTITTSNLGEDYSRLLQMVFSPWHGKTDFVVGFLRKATRLLGDPGFVSFIATSSLIRGESLESGLQLLLRDNWTLFRAHSPRRWPGTAGVEIVDIYLARRWCAEAILDEVGYHRITELLEGASATVILESAYELLAGGLDAFLGVKVSPGNLRIGVTEATAIIKNYPVVERFLTSALGGEELYNLHDYNDAPRIVNPSAFAATQREIGAVHELLGPFAGREAGDFLHSGPALELTKTLLGKPLAFACGETSVHLSFVRIMAATHIPRHKLIVIPAGSWSLFAAIQSSVHIAWAWHLGLRRKADFVYSPKRCASTFVAPPESQSIETLLSDIGERYHEHRRAIMTARKEGLTKTYNRFHDARQSDADIATLRELHRAMDHAVAHAYGWDDLDLGHGFHTTKQGGRYTICETARREVLSRLLRLNHARYAEEVAAGLHDKGKKGKAPRGRATPQRKTADGTATPQGVLFGRTDDGGDE